MRWAGWWEADCYCALGWWSRQAERQRWPTEWAAKSALPARYRSDLVWQFEKKFVRNDDWTWWSDGRSIQSAGHRFFLLSGCYFHPTHQQQAPVRPSDRLDTPWSADRFVWICEPEHKDCRALAMRERLLRSKSKSCPLVRRAVHFVFGTDSIWSDSNRVRLILPQSRLVPGCSLPIIQIKTVLLSSNWFARIGWQPVSNKGIGDSPAGNLEDWIFRAN